MLCRHHRLRQLAERCLPARRWHSVGRALHVSSSRAAGHCWHGSQRCSIGHASPARCPLGRHRAGPSCQQSVLAPFGLVPPAPARDLPASPPVSAAQQSRAGTCRPGCLLPAACCALPCRPVRTTCGLAAPTSASCRLQARQRGCWAVPAACQPGRVRCRPPAPARQVGRSTAWGLRVGGGAGGPASWVLPRRGRRRTGARRAVRAARLLGRRRPPTHHPQIQSDGGADDMPCLL